MSWETAVGLEVHLQLATRTKLFCGCAVEFGAPPNARTCEVCSGQPGCLPVPNAEAVALAVRLALAVDAEVRLESRFERKNYHYADLPKAYQISQYERPLCRGGRVPLPGGGSAPLERIHLEEDAGKALHDRGAYTLVDLNRAGVPLVEVVGEPVLGGADEAVGYLESLRELARWVGAGTAHMERGEMRCDVNVSVRRPGAELGTKVEVKNLNSFRHVHDAIEHEVARQVAALEAGEVVTQETRLFDPATGETRVMRTKESADDYRYFPDPDLPPLVLSESFVEDQRRMLPELPAARRTRYRSELSLSDYDAGVLTAERLTSEWFEGLVRAGAPPKAAANWVANELLGALTDGEVPAATLDELPFTPRELSALLALVGAGELSTAAARRVFTAMAREGGDPRHWVEELGLARVTDEGEVEAWCRAALEEKPDAAEAVRAGNEKALGALIGPVMKQSGGRADPSQVRAVLRRLLEA